jgi:hypothetical protein
MKRAVPPSPARHGTRLDRGIRVGFILIDNRETAAFARKEQRRRTADAGAGTSDKNAAIEKAATHVSPIRSEGSPASPK